MYFFSGVYNFLKYKFYSNNLAIINSQFQNLFQSSLSHQHFDSNVASLSSLNSDNFQFYHWFSVSHFSFGTSVYPVGEPWGTLSWQTQFSLVYSPCFHTLWPGTRGGPFVFVSYHYHWLWVVLGHHLVGASCEKHIIHCKWKILKHW